MRLVRLLMLIGGVAVAAPRDTRFKNSRDQGELGQSVDEKGYPKVIRVERKSPVFKDPSSKSKILADVDAGTVLIARELSRRGGWVKVEDEDGNQGWVPRTRTNEASLAPPVSEPEKVNDSEIKEAEDREKLEKGEPVMMPAHVNLANVQAGLLGFGLNYGFYWAGDDRRSARRRMTGLELGAYRAWILRPADDFSYTFPLKVRMIAHDKGSYFASGPELGLLFRLKDHGFAGEAGYSFGIVPAFEKGFTSMLRGAIEFGGKTRFQLQWDLGWLF